MSVTATGGCAIELTLEALAAKDRGWRNQNHGGVVCGFPGEQERVLALLQLPAVSAVLDQEKERAQPVMGPGLSNVL